MTLDVELTYLLAGNAHRWAAEITALSDVAAVTVGAR